MLDNMEPPSWCPKGLLYQVYEAHIDLCREYHRSMAHHEPWSAPPVSEEQITFWRLSKMINQKLEDLDEEAAEAQEASSAGIGLAQAGELDDFLASQISHLDQCRSSAPSRERLAQLLLAELLHILDTLLDLYTADEPATDVIDRRCRAILEEFARREGFSYSDACKETLQNIGGNLQRRMPAAYSLFRQQFDFDE